MELVGIFGFTLAVVIVLFVIMAIGLLLRGRPLKKSSCGAAGGSCDCHPASGHVKDEKDEEGEHICINPNKSCDHRREKES